MKKHRREDRALVINLTDEEAQDFRKAWEDINSKPQEITITTLEPEVKILKEKKGVPTVIEWNGKRYILHHADQFKR